MKRIINNYKINRILLIAAVMNTIVGVMFLVMFRAVHYISDDIIRNSSPVEKIILLPAWFFLELFSIAGLAVGVPFTISGIVCLILVFPYLGRMRKISKARRKNGRKIPKDLLEEMLQSGELGTDEYERELANYAPAKKDYDDGEKPGFPVKGVFLRIVGAAVVLGVMIGLPVAIGYLLGIMH